MLFIDQWENSFVYKLVRSEVTLLPSIDIKCYNYDGRIFGERRIIAIITGGIVVMAAHELG
jgi:hypothetical protein